MKDRRFLPYVLLGMLALALAAWLGFHPFELHRWRWVNEPLHSTLEAVGALAALIMGITLLLRKGEEADEKLFWLSLGFIGMGILDAFHALSAPGQGFVLLRAAAGLAGGFCFALVWLPASFSRVLRKKWLPPGVALVSLGFALWVFRAGEPWLKMVENGQFTASAVTINILAGIFFLAAAGNFLREFHRTRRGEVYYLALLALLFAMAQLMFPYSSLWDGEWWLWHFLRVAAYLLVLGFVVLRISLAGLRVRIIMLVLLALLPVTALMLYASLEQQRQEAADAQAEMLRLARMLVVQHEHVSESAHHLLQALIQIPSLHSGDTLARNSLLTKLHRQYPGYTALGLIAPNGEVTALSIPYKKPLNVADRAYFQRVMKTRRFAAGDFQKGRVLGKPVIIFAEPILDTEGRVQAVVIISLDLTWLNELLMKMGLPEGAVLNIIDRNGTIMARYPGPENWVGKTLPEGPIFKTILAQKGEGVAENIGVRGTLNLYGFAPIKVAEESVYYLCLGIPKEKVLAQADRMLKRNLGLLGLVAFLSLAAAWVSGTLLIIKPTGSLLKAVDSLTIGDLGARTGMTYGRDEIGHLAKSFDEMAEALEQHAAERQQNLEALAQKVEELAARQRLTQTVLATTDLDQHLTVALEECLRLLDSEIGAIYLTEGERLLLRAHRGLSEEYQAYMGDVPWAEHPWAGQFTLFRQLLSEQNKKDLAKEFPQESLRSFHKANLRAGLQAWVALPLQVENRLLGALFLASPRYDAFTAEGIKTLLALGEVLALTVQNVHLTHTANERLARLLTLREIDRAIMAHLKLEDIIKVVLARVKPHLGVDAVGLSLIDWVKKSTRLAHFVLPQGIELDRDAFTLSDSLLEWLERRQQPVVIYDLTQEPRVSNHREVIRRYGLRSYLGVPLVVMEQTIGVLHLLTTKPRHFREEEVEFFKTLAGQAAIALHHAQLYEKVVYSEEAFRNMVEHSNDLIWFLDKEGNFSYFNKQAEKLSGYKLSDWLCKSFAPMVSPADQPRIQKIFLETMKGKSQQYEVEVYKADGSLMTLSVNTSPLIEAGKIVGSVSFGRDITEEKRATEALRETKDFLDKLIHYANAPIIIWGPQLKILRFNKAFEYLTGYKAEEVIGKELDLLFPEADLDECLIKITATLMGEYWESVEIPILRKEGEIRITLWNSANIYTEDGTTFLATIAQGQDITERKRAEAALEAERQRLFSLLDELPALFYLQASDYSIRFANRYFRNRHQEMEGKYCYEILHGRKQPCEKCPALIVLKTKVPQEFVSTHIDGRNYQIYHYPFYDLDGSLLVLVLGIDITERKSLEAQLVQAQKMEAVGTLAGGVAHDFNNLLTAMMGNLELAKIKLERGQGAEEHLGEMENITQRAATLTNQLLAFSRRQIIQPVPLDLNDTITEMSKMLPRLIGEHITLEFRLEGNLGVVNADPGQLEQVIMNLCVNARDAMPTGGKLLLTTGNIRLEEDYINHHPWVEKGDYVLLEVADSGCGMDEATRQRIFEPFFTTKEVGKGTGLGLSMVYGIVKQHQGYIHVYSEPGRGTTFKIYLPRTEEKAAVAKVREAPEEVKYGQETILLAEDEDQLRETIKNILEMFGYTVMAASDGQEAIEIYEQEKERLHLVILDAVMPKMGGMEAADHIYKINPQQKILFSSGYSADALHEKFVIPPEMHFIQKPYRAKDLARKVREILDA